MTLEYGETKDLIDSLLKVDMGKAQGLLQDMLSSLGREAPEFYDGVILHGRGMTYTSDQWFDFHQKVPHWRLRRERALMDKLTPYQRELLEP